MMNDRAAAEKRKQEYRESLENELLGSAVETEKKLKKKLDQVETERFRLELDREEYETQIKELKSELHQSKAREDAYRAEAELSSKRKKALTSVREISKYPQTAEEVGEYFIIHFADRIDFTENGKNL